MFNLFKRKSELDKLRNKYKELLDKSHKLSTVNRQESDKVFYQANEVLNQIQIIEQANEDINQLKKE